MAIVVGVLLFPGTNCERETLRALSHFSEVETIPIWHKEKDLPSCDLVVLPGGFSYGDYLRAGALCRFSPIMNAVIEYANRGGCVLGICNGFQILVEARLLAGALLKNSSSTFVSREIRIRVERNDLPWTFGLKVGEVLNLPIAHGEGRYLPAGDPTFSSDQILFRYVDERGEATADANPNGSFDNIAGVVNPSLNVMGLMPHPERAFFPYHFSQDGQRLLRSVLMWLKERVPTE
jgi:phosphoribosylformylglycinamidine synthase